MAVITKARMEPAQGEVSQKWAGKHISPLKQLWKSFTIDSVKGNEPEGTLKLIHQSLELSNSDESIWCVLYMGCKFRDDYNISRL